MEEEKILDKEQWKIETAAVIKDIKNHVTSAGISLLDGSDDCIYFNITTLEGNKYCIQMSKAGFMIADTCHDSSTSVSEDYFETPYALLDKISPMYRQSFASKLIASLSALKDNNYGASD